MEKHNCTQFVEQVTRHHSSFVSFAYLATGNASLAEDLLQETYLRAWKARDQIKDWQLFRSWISRILRNESARRFAKNELNVTEFNEELYVSPIDFEEFKTRTREEALHSIKALPKLYRDPMWLFVQGSKCEDIAEHLQLNVNTVLTRLRRAKGQLLERGLRSE